MSDEAPDTSSSEQAPADDGYLERELKFAFLGLEGQRERLQELEAERTSSPSFEDNWILDRGDELVGADCLLRLRQDGHGARITFKGPASYEGGVKIRREHETRVDDLEQVRQILRQLGYGTVRRYQKVREEWSLGGVTIALDHTPIGDFIEFEGTGAETVAKRCGFTPEEAEERSYLALYDDHLAESPDSPPDMIFPE